MQLNNIGAQLAAMQTPAAANEIAGDSDTLPLFLQAMAGVQKNLNMVTTAVQSPPAMPAKVGLPAVDKSDAKA